MDDYTVKVIKPLPQAVQDFCSRVDAHPDFRSTAVKKNGRRMTMQLHVVFQNKVIGGLNRADKHWYIFEPYAQKGSDKAKIAEKHGFKLTPHKRNEEKVRIYWQANGYDAVGKFEKALEEMTGADL